MATWTAETSLGLGLRLVIIQAEPVSNIANPTLESDVAIEDDHEGGIAEAGQSVVRSRPSSGRRSIRWSSHPPGFRTPFDPEICLPALRGFGKRILEARGA